jgi:hypothetical protein
VGTSDLELFECQAHVLLAVQTGRASARHLAAF